LESKTVETIGAFETIHEALTHRNETQGRRVAHSHRMFSAVAPL